MSLELILRGVLPPFSIPLSPWAKATLGASEGAAKGLELELELN